MTNTQIQIPVKAYDVYTKNKDGSEAELVGLEYEATGFAIRDGVPNILLDTNTKWAEIFENDFYKQPNHDRQTDIYEISSRLEEDLGVWEGFVTSFIWRKIQFKNVFVQLVIGKRYYLPITLIKQIKDKIAIKSSKLDPSQFKSIYRNTDWEVKRPENAKNLFNEHIEFIGKINN